MSCHIMILQNSKAKRFDFKIIRSKKTYMDCLPSGGLFFAYFSRLPEGLCLGCHGGYLRHIDSLQLGVASTLRGR